MAELGVTNLCTPMSLEDQAVRTPSGCRPCGM